MFRLAPPSPRSDAGQATVEFVALLPLLGVAALGIWQLAVVGHAAWSASAGARVASRALAVGGEREAARAARRVAGPSVRVAFPGGGGGGAVRVVVPVRSVVGRSSLTTVSSTARFEPQR